MGVASHHGPERVSLRRRVTALLLAAAAPALIAGLCLVESSIETRQLVQAHRLATLTRVLRQQAAARADDLRSLELLLRPRDELDWRMFEGLARFGLLERDDVGGCAWAPRVSGRHREQYETFVELSAYRSFRISEWDGNGRLRDASTRDELYPLHFVAPPESGGLPLGIDLASDPAVAAAIEHARDENTVGALLTSAWGRESGEAALLVLLPVYRPRADLGSVEARRAALEGFLIASLLLSPEVGTAVGQSDIAELQANLSASPIRRPRRFSPLDTTGQWLSQSTTTK